jgi:plastocyanin
MKKIILGLSLLVLVFGLLFVKSSNKNDTDKTQSTKSTNQVQVANAVSIQNFSFGPDKLIVKKGTKVTWTNMDDAHHDITPTGGGSDFVASKLLAKDEKYEFTFNTVGIYTYKCSPHPYMKGTIEVTE